MREFVIVLYFALLAIIALYGVHLYWLIWLYLRRKPKTDRDLSLLSKMPRITVQLPVYNEQLVVKRLIRAAAALDWDRKKLEIQVLDDSDDVTRKIAAEQVDEFKGQGYHISHISRTDRTGYKAGALANGLKQATGDYIAIFDADNLPRPDFLQRMIPRFAAPDVGLVQARWSFLNRESSLLCRAQALFLDAHFHIEQAARSRGDLFMNFNGTAGVWRRKAIEESGGWQSDTLTEDLDLSYRAQIIGWRMVLAEDVDVPTELPSNIRAFKSQQFRWANGAFQTGLKLLPSLMRTTQPARVKLAACFHLTQKLISVTLLLLSLLLIPALYFRLEGGMYKVLLLDLPIFLAGTVSMSIFYGLVYRRGNVENSLRNSLTLPLLTSLGIGLAVNNTFAVMAAVLRRRKQFIRTPKTGEIGAESKPLPSAYRVRFDLTGGVECALGLYTLGAFGCALFLGLYPSLPFLLTFVFGYLYFAFLSVKEWYV